MSQDESESENPLDFSLPDFSGFEDFVIPNDDTDAQAEEKQQDDHETDAEVIPGTRIHKLVDVSGDALSCEFEHSTKKPVVFLLGQSNTALGVLTDFLFGKFSRTYNKLHFVRIEFADAIEHAAKWGLFSSPAYLFVRHSLVIGKLSGAHPSELELILAALQTDYSTDISVLISSTDTGSLGVSLNSKMKMCVGQDHDHKHDDTNASAFGFDLDMFMPANSSNANANDTPHSEELISGEDAADGVNDGYIDDHEGEGEGERMNTKELFFAQMEELLPGVANLAGWWVAHKLLGYLVPNSAAKD